MIINNIEYKVNKKSRNFFSKISELTLLPGAVVGMREIADLDVAGNGYIKLGSTLCAVSKFNIFPNCYCSSLADIKAVSCNAGDTFMTPDGVVDIDDNKHYYHYKTNNFFGNIAKEGTSAVVAEVPTSWELIVE